jgi:hypothetical protein
LGEGHGKFRSEGNLEPEMFGNPWPIPYCSMAVTESESETYSRYSFNDEIIIV